MAAIDKIYTNSYKDYKDFVDWAKDKSFFTPRGFEIKVSNYIIDWDESDFIEDGNPKERPISNTPVYVDNYLYNNCPFGFIKKSLEENYSGSYSKGSMDDLIATPKLPEFIASKKVKIVKRGLGNHPVPQKAWHVEIEKTDDKYTSWYWYNEDRDCWLLPEEDEPWTSSCAYERRSVKAIIRKIIKGKWKIPAGCTITISGRLIRDTWILKTK